jgi:translation initiation factor 1 (eIF-1/SUI1)
MLTLHLIKEHKVVSVETIGTGDDKKYRLRLKKEKGNKIKSVTIVSEHSVFVANGGEVIAELEKRFGCKLKDAKGKTFRALIQKENNKNTIRMFDGVI